MSDTFDHLNDAFVDDADDGYELVFKRCRRCGAGGLLWMQAAPGVWRLHYEDGQLHECADESDHLFSKDYTKGLK